MTHSFKVGGRYRNRRGEYEVVSIDDSNMVIRYSDGSILESPIVDQDRIWRNIQMEKGERPSKRSPGTRPQRKIHVPKVEMVKSIDELEANIATLKLYLKGGSQKWLSKTGETLSLDR